MKMAIYNYGLPYPQYQYPVQQTVSNTPITTNNSAGIIWVQGEAGAKAYPVAPGNSVLLMDSESECFFIKSTDASGVPLPLRAFSYSEIVQTQQSHTQEPKEQYVTKTEFEELKHMFEELQSRRKENRNEQIIPRNSKQ